MKSEKRDYLNEDCCYQNAQREASPYYQHCAGDPCDAALSEVLSWDSFPAGDHRLLELGCGDGFITAVLAKRGLSVTGVDCSPTAIKRATTNLRTTKPPVTLHVQDICMMDAFEPQSFPYILDSHCLHCVTDYAQRAAFLRSCRQALAPDGRFFIVTMASQPMDWFAGYKDKPSSPELHVDDRGCHVMTLDPPSGTGRFNLRIWIEENVLREEIAAAGFDIVRFDRFAPADDPNDLDFLVELT